MHFKRPSVFRTLLAGAFCFQAFASQAQQETFVLPPQKIDFYAQSNTTLPTFVNATYTAANSGYNGEGRLEFTIVDNKLLDRDGTQITTIAGIDNAYTISIVPKPGNTNCNLYSVIMEGPYFSGGTTVDRVLYLEVSMGTSAPVISTAPITISSGVNFNRGIAVSKLNSLNQRDVFIGSLAGIDHHVLSSAGLTTTGTKVCYGLWNGVHELELSEDENTLFWSAGQGGPFMQRADISSWTPVSLPVGSAPVTFYPVRAHSIEYSPIDDKLYFIRSGRLYKVNSDFSGSHVQVAPSFSQSTIEKNHEGLIIGVNNKTTLNTYNPASGTLASGAYSFPALLGGPGTSNLILPDQVDGEVYVTHPTFGLGVFIFACQTDPPFDLFPTPMGGTFTGTAWGSTFMPAWAAHGANLVTYTTLNDAGCPAVTQIYVDVSHFCKTGEDGSTVEYEVTIFPNPAKDVLHINGIDGAATVSLFDLSGRQVAQEQFNGTTQLSVGHLPAGNYVLHLEDNFGNEVHEQIVIQ